MSVGMFKRGLTFLVVGLGFAQLARADQSAGWKTYRNAALGFSISYPADYAVNEGYAYQALGPGRDIRGVSFTIPARAAKGTNLSDETRISVEVLPAATSCTPDLFLAGVEQRGAETVGPLHYGVATFADAGAGNRYDEAVYTISNSSPCIAIRYFIHSTNIANYDPGTVAAFDRNALVRQFDEIRRTLSVARLK